MGLKITRAQDTSIIISTIVVISVSLGSSLPHNPYLHNGRETKLSKIIEYGSKNLGPIDYKNREDIQKRIRVGLKEMYGSKSPLQVEPKMQLNLNQVKDNTEAKPKAVCARCQVGIIAIYCYCYGDDFDFAEQMQNISQTLEDSNQSKDFFMADMWNFATEEIPDNAFLDLTFQEMYLDNPIGLQRIHKNAFNSSAFTLQYDFLLWGANGFLLVDQPNTDYDMWAAFSSLANVEYLILTFGYQLSHVIPDNAFRQINGPQNNLVEIVFELGYNISRIGAYAFSQLTNLNDGVIDLSYIQIDHISQHAFDFAYENDRYVYVDLRYCGLTENSFDTGSLIGRNRPLIVYLSHNKLQYIPQNVFEDFFNGDHRSLLFIDDNPLNCSDTAPFEWLLLASNRNELMARIIYPYCANGTELWHLNVGLPATDQPVTCPAQAPTTACTCENGNASVESAVSCFTYIVFANLISFVIYTLIISY